MREWLRKEAPQVAILAQNTIAQCLKEAGIALEEAGNQESHAGYRANMEQLEVIAPPPKQDEGARAILAYLFTQKKVGKEWEAVARQQYTWKPWRTLARLFGIAVIILLLFTGIRQQDDKKLLAWGWMQLPAFEMPLQVILPEENLGNALKIEPVSYTHLTLPTTPYV